MALTIRLSKKEAEQIEAVKGLLDKKTASGAIKHMINNYIELHCQVYDLEKEKEDLLNALKKSQSTITKFVDAYDELSNLR